MGKNNSRDWRTLPPEYQWRFCTEGYLAHPDGTIKSVDRWMMRNGKKILRRGKVLKPRKDKDGYLVVDLYKDGKRKNYFVHRLVAQAFIPNPDNLPCINHISEIKTDNRVENLEWCSHKENINWGTRNERMAKALSKPVQGINPDTGEVVVEFPSASECGRNGYYSSAISNCCRGKYGYKTHKGLIWHYKDEYKPIKV